jgi:hypothetical protein
LPDEFGHHDPVTHQAFGEPGMIGTEIATGLGDPCRGGRLDQSRLGFGLGERRLHPQHGIEIGLVREEGLDLLVPDEG